VSCQIRIERAQHRVRIEGDCAPDDAEAVQRAITSVSDETGEPVPVIVDLSRVQRLDSEVAEAISRACEHAECSRVSVLRRCGSEVDRVLSSAGL
jgi:anti-anti-sigma regulatory factor